MEEVPLGSWAIPYASVFLLGSCLLLTGWWGLKDMLLGRVLAAFAIIVTVGIFADIYQDITPVELVSGIMLAFGTYMVFLFLIEVIAPQIAKEFEDFASSEI